MKEEIMQNFQDPLELEKLYRDDPDSFKSTFSEMYTDIKDKAIAEFWNIRLNFDTIASGAGIISNKQEDSRYKTFSLAFAILAALIAGTLVRVPEWLGYNADIYIPNNLAFFVLPMLCIYYMIKNRAEVRDVMLFSVAIFSGVLFMNLVPWAPTSDTRMLSSLHFIFIMWAMLGAAFTGFTLTARDKQMQFLRRNGDVIMLSGIILICGMMLMGLTVGLFEAIGIKLPEEAFKNIATFGICGAPIIANYMIESSPKMITKVLPFISRIFTPLILGVMTIFLIALTFFAKDPFSSRQELIAFNVLLAVNLAVIVFSFSGSTGKPNSFQNKVLLLLSAEALLINVIALSAIVYRLFAFGITPNRLAVVGLNVLMFINLIIIALRLFSYVRNKTQTEEVHKGMTVMLPWYTCWSVIAAFVFPLIFWFS